MQYSALVIMATNASVPLFIWHVISKYWRYCPFISKIPLGISFIPFQRQWVCFYLCHSYPAQLHIMAFHSSPHPHCIYQGVSSSWSLSTSSTFNWNILKNILKKFLCFQERKFCSCLLVFHLPNSQVQHVDKGHDVNGKALSLTFTVASYWHSGRRDIQTVKVKRKGTLINSKVMHRNSKLCRSLFRLQFVLFGFNFRFNVKARF